MSATMARERRTNVVVRSLLVVALIAGAVTAALLAGTSRERPPAPLCHPPSACVAGLDGGETLVSTSTSGPPDASLEPAADGSVSLVGLDGRRRWRVSTGSTIAPQLVAAGDIGTDGITDYIVGLTRPLASARTCGSGTLAESSLLAIDGRTGQTSSPVRALPDICWTSLNYATRQWTAGTAYIGEFTDAYRGRELVVIPHSATHGRVWNLAESGRWRLARTPSAEQFPFPSTPAFDRAYNATNPEPCSTRLPGGPCHTPGSHVANAVFPAGADGGLFALTSSRAVVYRPDLTPTSDLVWSPGGNLENAGRNYGLVETYRTGDGVYVDLVGGCSTLYRSHAMAPGAEPTGGDPNCGIVRHFERFQVTDSRIAQHQSVYYGYLGTHGALEGRVEFPARAHAPLGGPATSWTVFNLLRSGSWSAQIFTGPMSTQPIELPGWYVWDTVELEGGGAGLLASRVPAGSLVPAWELDVLRWNGSTTFASAQHLAGVVPVLLPYASTPTRHTSESSLYGAYVGPGRRRDLLVVDAAGGRRFVSLAAAG